MPLLPPCITWLVHRPTNIYHNQGKQKLLKSRNRVSILPQNEILSSRVNSHETAKVIVDLNTSVRTQDTPLLDFTHQQNIILHHINHQYKQIRVSHVISKRFQLPSIYAPTSTSF